MATSEILLKILQGTGDVYNFDSPLAPEEPEDPEFDRDPALRLLLRRGRLNPVTASLLVQKDNEKIARERIQHQIQKAESGLEPEESPGIISWIGPVPVGFQFGTWAGIENPVLRFAVDLVSDPLNFITGIGALTKIGRAAKLLKGLSPIQKADKIIEGAKALAVIGADEALAKEIGEAAVKGEGKKLTKLFKKAANTDLDETQIQRLVSMDVDPDFIEFVKNPKAEKRGLVAMFRVKDQEKQLQLADTFLGRIKSGQQGLVNFGLPFDAAEFGSLRFAKVVEGIIKTDEGLKSAKSAYGKIKDVASDLVTDGIRIRPKEDLDVRNTVETLNALRKGVDSTLDVVSGQAFKRQYGTDWLSSGENIGAAFSFEWKGVEASATNLQSLLHTVTRNNPEVRKVLTEILDKPGQKVHQFVTDSELESGFKNVYESAAYQKLADYEKHVVDELIRFNNGMEELAIDAQIFQDGVENYVARIVRSKTTRSEQEISRIIKEAVHDVSSAGRRKLPGTKHGLKRAFDTLDELREYARKHPDELEIVTEDVADITGIYTDSMGKAVVRNRTLETMMRSKMNDGWPAAFSKETMGEAAKQMSRRQREVLKKAYGTIDNATFKNFFFHKDILGDVKPFFDRNLFKEIAQGPQTIWSKAITGLDYLNGLFKATLFNFNPLFHATTLVLSNMALLPPGAAVRNVFDAARKIRLSKDPQVAHDLVVQMMNRSFDIAGDLGTSADDLMEQMRLSPLQLTRTSEAQQGHSAIQNLLDGIISSLDEKSMFRNVFTGLKHFNQIGDRNLWLVMQNTMKQASWVHVRQGLVQKFFSKAGRMPVGEDLFKINHEAGQMVNAAFGGNMWERLGATATMQKFARWAMLAPDWTVSNMLMARDVFAGMVGKAGIGKVINRDVMLGDARFHWALGYNIRAGFYAYSLSNLANYAFTFAKDGKGRFLFENDQESYDERTGFKTRIELPYTNADGRRQFMNVFKQFVEPLHMLRDPGDFVQAKMGALPRVFQSVVIGQDAFGNEIAGTADGPYLELVKRIFETSGQFLPIPLQGAFDSARGFRDPRSVLISTAGFNIRSEDKKNFETRQRIAELRERAASLQRR